MTLSDVARTAYRDMSCNRICPSCKHDGPDDIRDTVSLAPFKAYYKHRKFTALHCSFCGAVWSHLIDEKKDTLMPNTLLPYPEVYCMGDPPDFVAIVQKERDDFLTLLEAAVKKHNMDMEKKDTLNPQTM